MIGRRITKNLDGLCIVETCSVKEVIACIDRNEKGIALVVDDDRRLIGTVTDGDVRRAILAGLGVDSTIGELLSEKPTATPRHPVTAAVGTDNAKLLRIMRQKSIQQIPLLDEYGRIVDLATRNDLTPDTEVPLKAVIMAGGRGARLRPLTENMPKPMLPVGDRPLMEHIIDGLRGAGIKHVNITTNYKSEKIVEHFGNGEGFGVNLTYVPEGEPLGTAGSLSLLGEMSEPLLVINGDILTQMNFRSMLDYHREYEAELTIAVRQYDFQVPYGVVECDGPFVAELREKPLCRFFVNAGIYMLEPAVRNLVPSNRRFDMTDLIDLMISNKRRVACFPVVEYWLDIGQHDDYVKAQKDVQIKEGK